MMTKLIKFCFSLLFTTCIFTASSQTITGTEAVEYDPTANRFLITNGSSILQQNSGSSELNFFGNGGASYGMEVIGNTLYVITGGSVQRVDGYDLDSESEIFSSPYTGGGFLNGMASDPTTNRIWVTDFSNNDIIEYDVSDPSNVTYEVVVSNAGCTPNGITHDADNNRLVYACWSGGNVRSCDLDDYSLATMVNTGLNNIDGIDHDNNGNFYISSWSPTRITKLSSEFSVDEIITAPGLSSPADISYAIEIDTLAIANSGNNSITYIGFDTGVGFDEIDIPNNLQVYPNPVTENSIISFELTAPTSCQANLIDQNGRLVKVLLQEDNAMGSRRILMTGLNLSAGVYLCEVVTDSSSQLLKLVVE